MIIFVQFHHGHVMSTRRPWSAHLKPAQVSHGECGFPVNVPPGALKLRYASAQLDKKHKQPQDVKSCDLL